MNAVDDFHGLDSPTDHKAGRRVQTVGWRDEVIR